MRVRIVLNGTKTNPYLKLGFKRNPFPQIARAEMMHVDDQLAELAAEPIASEQQLVEKLKRWGWSEELTKLCIAQFKPGKLVHFSIEFPTR